MSRHIKAAMLMGLTGLLGLWGQQAQAETPAPPQVDTSALPPVAQAWQEPNPYRNTPAQAEAQALGRLAFNQTCARCHGADADGSRAPAPDLRRLSRHCNALNPGAWRDRCMADADAYFLKSVRFGKKKFDIEHMPAWDGVLSQEVVWSIRSFVENTARP